MAAGSSNGAGPGAGAVPPLSVTLRSDRGDVDVSGEFAYVVRALTDRDDAFHAATTRDVQRAINETAAGLAGAINKVAAGLCERIDEKESERAEAIMDGLIGVSSQLSALSERMSLLEARLDGQGKVKTIERDRRGNISAIREEPS